MGVENTNKRPGKELTDEGCYELTRKGLPRTKKKVLLPVKLTKLKQSNLITTMQADYNIMHTRVLVKMIEKLQPAIDNIINKKVHPEQLQLFKDFENGTDIKIVIPFKEFGVSASNYPKLKKALQELSIIPVEFDTTDPMTGREMWGYSGFFRAFMHKEKYNREIHIMIHKDIATMIIFQLAGYTQYYKEIALSSSNKYTSRIYMLISSWKDKGGFSIKYSKFRAMLGLKDKYREFKDFYRRVIRPVYEELFEKADVWFEVAEIYEEEKDREPSLLSFKVVKGITSAQDEARLASTVQQYRVLWSKYLFLKKEHIEEMLKFVTFENASEVTVKGLELMQYVSDNIEKIAHPTNYCYKAMMSLLCPFKELDEA